MNVQVMGIILPEEHILKVRLELKYSLEGINPFSGAARLNGIQKPSFLTYLCVQDSGDSPTYLSIFHATIIGARHSTGFDYTPLFAPAARARADATPATGHYANIYAGTSPTSQRRMSGQDAAAQRRFPRRGGSGAAGPDGEQEGDG
ncbi:hypothetical protein B0H13DRAFT_1886362 [Mycena leptocephala]|nr:hypothetical protein B0H13DRAFT_1886362 [Mycena leptocephala]